jgi:polyhydroxyalkanoate synthesis regulator phasin
MGMTRQEAELISELSETMAVALKDVAESLLERIKTLEQKIAVLEAKPRMSLAQKLRARGEA